MLCVVPRAFCSYGFPYACDGYIYSMVEWRHSCGKIWRHHFNANEDESRFLAVINTPIQVILYTVMIGFVFYGLQTAAFATRGESQFLWQKKHGAPEKPVCGTWKSCECTRSTQRTEDEGNLTHLTCEEWSNCKYCFGTCNDKSTCDVFNSRLSECINEKQCIWNGNTGATYSKDRCATCIHNIDDLPTRDGETYLKIDGHHELYGKAYMGYVHAIQNEAGIWFAFPFVTLPKYFVEFFSNPFDILQNRLSDLKSAFTNDDDMDGWIRGIIFARFLCMLMLKYSWITFTFHSMCSGPEFAKSRSYEDFGASKWKMGAYLGRYGDEDETLRRRAQYAQRYNARYDAGSTAKRSSVELHCEAFCGV